MPFIQVKLWKGRTNQQKKDLIAGITRATADATGCPQEVVHVLIEEHDKENWGIAGEPSSERFPEE